MKNSNNYTVYVHTNKTNNKKYVGITKNRPEERWQHGEGYIGNKNFYNDIVEYGWDEFDHDIIETHLSRMDAAIMEAELIKEYKSDINDFGYNISPGMTKYICDDDNNTAAFTLRIPTKMKSQLEYIAESEYRTLNNMITYICAKYINQFDKNDE